MDLGISGLTARCWARAEAWVARSPRDWPMKVQMSRRRGGLPMRWPDRDAGGGRGREGIAARMGPGRLDRMQSVLAQIERKLGPARHPGEQHSAASTADGHRHRPRRRQMADEVPPDRSCRLRFTSTRSAFCPAMRGGRGAGSLHRPRRGCSLPSPTSARRIPFRVRSL